MQKKTIVFSSDNFFSIHACALLNSIEKNSNFKGIDIHIFSDGIKQKNKKALDSISKLPITIHEFDDAFIKDHPLPNKITYLPRSAYLRLFIPDIFQDAERVLYIDVDTIVMSSLEELFAIPFEGKACLACEDYGETETKSKIYNKFMQKTSPYFNSGLMVINLQKWKDENIKKRSYALLENEMKDPIYADQEVLNVLLENDWKTLNPFWNYPPHVSDYDNLPKVIHFMGYKPIYTDYKDKHKDTFYELLKGTKWENKEYGIIKKALVKGPYKLKSLLVKYFKR